jgi:hypothetical protein
MTLTTWENLSANDKQGRINQLARHYQETRPDLTVSHNEIIYYAEYYYNQEVARASKKQADTALDNTSFNLTEETRKYREQQAIEDGKRQQLLNNFGEVA